MILGTEQVEKSFGHVRAVRGISLAIRTGEILALLGPNGAGKTTLLRMMIGMIRPDTGRIVYALDGREADRPDPTRIGYLPEERGLYLDVPVRRVLLYFAALRGMGRTDARREADRWLERLGLADRAGEDVKSLSKGNQQKVQFISSVLHRPRLAILDEPFSGLDPLNQDLFLDLIREIRSAGTTVLISAHQMQLVERLADRILLIREGAAVSEGSVAALRERWGAGRRLRLRFEGQPDLGFLAALPGVREVTGPGPGEVEISLASDGSISPLLEAIGRRLEVVDLTAQEVTLHEIYVGTMGADGGRRMP